MPQTPEALLARPSVPMPMTPEALRGASVPLPKTPEALLAASRPMPKTPQALLDGCAPMQKTPAVWASVVPLPKAPHALLAGAAVPTLSKSPGALLVAAGPPQSQSWSESLLVPDVAVGTVNMQSYHGVQYPSQMPQAMMQQPFVPFNSSHFQSFMPVPPHHAYPYYSGPYVPTYQFMPPVSHQHFPGLYGQPCFTMPKAPGM
jgi:hypothetical protein